MNGHFMKYACCLMVFLFGCSTPSNQRADRVEGILNKRLEKRLDDLSGAITLLINDANRLHTDVEDAKAAHSATQRKMEELEASFRSLCEQIAGHNVPARTGTGSLSPARETAVKSQLPDADIAIPAMATEPVAKPEASTQTMVDIEKLLPVAQGFWDALNAKDVQAARSFATRESGASIHVKDTEGPNDKKCTVSFGNIKIEGGKAAIETALQAQDEPAIPIQTVLVQENGQWKVDASQTMMSMFGGVMGEMVKGLGKALEEGFKKGIEEMGKSLAEGLQSNTQEPVQVSDGTPDAVPPKQESPAVSEAPGTETSRNAVTEKAHPDKPATETASQQKPEAPVSVGQAMPENTTQISVPPAGVKPEAALPKEIPAPVAVTAPPTAEDAQKTAQEVARKPDEIRPEAAPPKQEATTAGDANDLAKRESYLKENVVRFADAGFSGKKGIQWNLIGFEHKSHMTYAEVEPSPSELEHPRYKFIVSFKDPAAPRLIGMMCLKDGQYVLYSAKNK